MDDGIEGIIAIIFGVILIGIGAYIVGIFSGLENTVGWQRRFRLPDEPKLYLVIVIFALNAALLIGFFAPLPIF
jgi:hypothetical protein